MSLIRVSKFGTYCRSKAVFMSPRRVVWWGSITSCLLRPTRRMGLSSGSISHPSVSCLESPCFTQSNSPQSVLLHSRPSSKPGSKWPRSKSIMCERPWQGYHNLEGPPGSQANSQVAKSATLLPLASRESPFWCCLQWTMATILGNQIASSRAKISSLFLISFSAEVSNPLFL